MAHRHGLPQERDSDAGRSPRVTHEIRNKREAPTDPATTRSCERVGPEVI